VQLHGEAQWYIAVHDVVRGADDSMSSVDNGVSVVKWRFGGEAVSDESMSLQASLLSP